MHVVIDTSSAGFTATAGGQRRPGGEPDVEHLTEAQVQGAITTIPRRTGEILAT